MNSPYGEPTAENPVENGKLPHLKLKIDSRVPELFFLPGDPDRLKLFEEVSDSFSYLSVNREFSIGKGTYKGKEFGVCSTGIGGGSSEIVMVELHTLGVKRVVRVGGCGALKKEIECGDMIINSGAVRLGGSSRMYVRIEYPAVADPFMVVALFNSSRKNGIKAHVGIGATVDSYYAGQGRAVPGLENSNRDLPQIFSLAGVLNFDMETETIFTLASLLGMKAANILAVHGNRETNTWLSDYRAAQISAIRTALEADFERL
jgi:uridine phosphorylase